MATQRAKLPCDGLARHGLALVCGARANPLPVFALLFVFLNACTQSTLQPEAAEQAAMAGEPAAYAGEGVAGQPPGAARDAALLDSLGEFAERNPAAGAAAAGMGAAQDAGAADAQSQGAPDAGGGEPGPTDAGPGDGGPSDAGTGAGPDAGTIEDAGAAEGGPADSGAAEVSDGGRDAGQDTGPVDDSVCGDGVIEGQEDCEGLNLNGMTCESLSAGSGLLFCDPVVCKFDTSACVRFGCGRFGCGFF